MTNTENRLKIEEVRVQARLASDEAVRLRQAAAAADRADDLDLADTLRAQAHQVGMHADTLYAYVERLKARGSEL